MAEKRDKLSTAWAVDQLRTLIFDGDLAAGSDHLEGDLAQRLGLSRTPVREALLTLETQGLVEIRPRKGVRIRPISPQDMAEIYDVLTELESLAAYDAARAGLDTNALLPLVQAIAQMETALRNGSPLEWAKADDEFHRELVRLGGNSRVIDIVAVMSDQVRRARLATLYVRPAPTQSNVDHRGVYDAIARGDGDGARMLHRAHRLAAKDMLIELLNRHPLQTL